MARMYSRLAYPTPRESLSCRLILSERQTGPVLAWHRSNPEDKADAGEEGDPRENHEEIARRDDCLGAFGLRVERIAEKAERLSLIEAFLALFNRCNECAAILPRVADVAEQSHLQRGVRNPRDDEHENDRWSDEEQLTI
jgi:hypothetical protein